MRISSKTKAEFQAAGVSAQSFNIVWLCNSMDCSLPGSSVHGLSQARILEWVAISFSRESSQPRDWSHISCVSWIGRWILYHFPTCEAWFSSYFWIKHNWTYSLIGGARWNLFFQSWRILSLYISGFPPCHDTEIDTSWPTYFLLKQYYINYKWMRIFLEESIFKVHHVPLGTWEMLLWNSPLALWQDCMQS